MEAAGVVLGALPLVLYAIDNYHRCLEASTDFWRFESTLKLIRSHVFIQQQQLQITLRSIGLVNPTPVQLELHLRQFHPEKCDAFVDIIKHMEHLLAKLMDKLDIDSRGKPRWSDEPPDRISWEWRRVRRSFGRASRQKLVDELQFWNDALKNCFEKTELPLAADDAPNSTLQKVQSTFDSNVCSTVRQHAVQIHRALSRAWGCSSHYHRGGLKLQWHTESAKAPEYFDIALSTRDDGIVETWQDITLEVRTLSKTKDIEIHDRAPSPEPVLDQTRSMRKRLKALVQPNLKPIKMRPPAVLPPRHCPPLKSLTVPPEVSCLCSFLHNQDPALMGRLGMNPQSSTGSEVWLKRHKGLDLSATAVPLSEMLSSSDLRGSPYSLPRKDRFALAAAAVWAALYLSDSPWLSLEWNAAEEIQVLFDTAHGQYFPSTTSLFTRAPRQASLEASKEQPPNIRLSTFNTPPGLIQNQTLFTLGILLIELALNKSFDQLRRETQADSILSAFGAENSLSDYDIASLYMQKVYLEAGDFYGYAVQRCLRCEFPGRDITKNFHFETFRGDFFNFVVAPVQATFMMLPSTQFAL